MSEYFPRRCHLDRMTPAELAITAAVNEVECLPPDTRLTDAAVLLGQARERVSDFVDGVTVTRDELYTVEYEHARTGATGAPEEKIWFPAIETFRSGTIDNPWARAETRAQLLRERRDAHRNVRVIGWRVA